MVVQQVKKSRMPLRAAGPRQAVEYGLSLVEEERRRGDEERAVLLARIDSMAAELSETRRQLCDKVWSGVAAGSAQTPAGLHHTA